ncbi:protein of unknown function [Pseudomonas sp. JV551A1]|uniref:Uncharacterized protein n=1 Tax=Pseudomonas inefficax TaxID=2078786 RepID=A0AAQ1STT6_9PSED|nr:protein of unknown function [Pseudomonas sp. JV551A1]SPO61013.1 protein of unknown function [Pseudomonas inefficax]
MQPIATQGRSYMESRSPVGAALCRDGAQSAPMASQNCAASKP